VPFGKTKDQRRLFEPTSMNGNALPDRENPGPGHYDAQIRVSNRVAREEKKASAAFASDVPQLHDAIQNYRASLPGPSNYRPLDASQRNQVLHTGVSSFGSHTERTTMFDRNPETAETPGPGSYAGGVAAASTISAKAATALAQLSSDADSAFGTTSARPCLAPTKTATAESVGPGAYGDSRTFSGLTQKINHMATVGARGVFSTTAARFQPDVNVDGSRIQDTPGVGRYKLKQPRYQRDRESSSFQSASTRRARPAVGPPEFTLVGSDATPGAGEYNVEGSLSIGGAAAAQLASKGRSTASNNGLPFSATAPRLVRNEIFGQQLRATPGPGEYVIDTDTVGQRANGERGPGARRALSATGDGGGGFGGSTVRFQNTKEAPTVGTYGAGFDTESMVRKSFNRKAG
jgi:hypothetical protein